MYKYYEGFIRMCLALPVHGQLSLINQQIEALQQVWQRNLQKQIQASQPAVPQTPLASGSCASRTEVPQTPVTPAANAVHAGPSVSASLTESKRNQLIRTATQAYECIVEHLKRDTEKRSAQAYTG